MKWIDFRMWNKKYEFMDSPDLIDFSNKKVKYDSDWYNFDEIELMQWTGLYDKRKIKIYKGDIVKYKNEIESGTFEVKYDNCEFYAGWKEIKNFMENTTSMKYLQCSNELEVIGNIYENGGEMNE